MNDFEVSDGAIVVSAYATYLEAERNAVIRRELGGDDLIIIRDGTMLATVRMGDTGVSVDLTPDGTGFA